jgi:hypothetical protein
VKYIGLFALASLASSVANAELIPGSMLIDFGNVSLGSASVMDVSVMNAGDDPVEGIVVSMTGNSNEFSWTDCPPEILPGFSCTISVSLVPLHYGKKKRKLNFDGYETVDGVQNDVSLTIPVIGSSDPFNKP